MVAIYARISKGVTEDDYAQSIQNQILLCRQWIGQHLSGEKEAKSAETTGDVSGNIIIYQDIGYTGTNLNRPAVQKLLAGIFMGRIHIVVVKDLSRLSRDHLRLSELMECTFPRYAVRLVSVSEDYDSTQEEQVVSGNMLRGIFFEYYCRDISKKVKEALRAKKEEGQHAVARVPYGYRKRSSSDWEAGGQEWEVCPEEAKEIQRIYRMSSEGMNCVQIAESLQETGKPRTVEDLQETGEPQTAEDLQEKSQSRIVKGLQETGKPRIVEDLQETGLLQRRESPEMPEQERWSAKKVWSILHNPVYLGRQVWHKSESSYQDGFVNQSFSRSQWIIGNATHPAIVSRELYEKVQACHPPTGSYGRKKGRRHMFHGLTRCLRCGSALCSQGGKREYLGCRKCARSAPVRIANEELWRICRMLLCPALEELCNTEVIELFLKFHVRKIYVGEGHRLYICLKFVGSLTQN